MKLVATHRGGVQRDRDRRVRTELMTYSEEERAVPLDDFNVGAICQEGTSANEILVGFGGRYARQSRPQRARVGR